MKLDQQYIPIESTAPLRGLATTFPSTRLNTAYSPSLLNVTLRDGIVQRRSGYYQIGSTLIGEVLALIDITFIGQDSQFIVITSKRQYLWDDSLQDFMDITLRLALDAITAVDQGAKKFTVAGDQNLKYVTGLPVIVTDSTGNDGQYTIDTVTVVAGPNTEIVVLEAIPDATVDGDIAVIVEYTMLEGDFISWAFLSDITGQRLLVTNGRDTPRLWDGSGEFTEWSPNYTDFDTCRVLRVFKDTLFMGHITVNSQEEPTTAAWSDAGDYDEFELGTSGVQILPDLEPGILNMTPLGDRLVVYSRNAIAMGIFVGLPLVFAFETIIPEQVRLISPHAVTSINIGHIYASEEEFVLFDGSRGLRIIGEVIRSDYKEVRKLESLHKAYLFNDAKRRTIYFSIPGFEENIIYTLEYNVFDLQSMIWAKEQYKDSPRVFGFFTNVTGLPDWDDPPDVEWEIDFATWGSESEQVGFPRRVFGEGFQLDVDPAPETEDFQPRGNVFLAAENILTDDGVSQTAFYETLDFTVPETFLSQFGRWGEIEFEARGVPEADFLVSVSLDKGASYTLVDTLNLEANLRQYSIPVDFHSRTFRVKFQTVNDFIIRWVRVWVRPGGPR